MTHKSLSNSKPNGKLHNIMTHESLSNKPNGKLLNRINGKPRHIPCRHNMLHIQDRYQ